MSRTLRAVFGIAWVVGFVVAAPVAGAQRAGAEPPPAETQGAQTGTPQGDEQARILFMAGQTYYDQGEYELALEQFERAYQLSPRTLLLLNAANAAERGGNLPSAIGHLERYLAQEPDAANRPTLERRLEAMRRRLERQQADTEPETPTTTAEPTTPSTAEPEEAAPAAEEPEPARRGIGLPAILSYAIGGGGVALFATFGTLTLVENGSLADGCGATRSCSDADLSKLRGFGIAADVGLGIGLAGAVTGTVLLFTSRNRGDEEADVAVTPWFGPGGGGASLRVAF